jgi:hypothetical protein
VEVTFTMQIASIVGTITIPTIRTVPPRGIITTSEKLIGYSKYFVFSLSVPRTFRNELESLKIKAYERRFLSYEQVEDHALECLMSSVPIEEILDKVSKSTLEDYENELISDVEVYKEYFWFDLEHSEDFIPDYFYLGTQDFELAECALTQDLSRSDSYIPIMIMDTTDFLTIKRLYSEDKVDTMGILDIVCKYPELDKDDFVDAQRIIENHMNEMMW